jgi:dimethylargininase
MRIAVVREVSRRIGECELTHLARRAIDVDLARMQHRLYLEALSSLGCKVVMLPEEPDLPDAVFVEDAAVVLDEIAVIARPGAPSRRPEVESIACALKAYRDLAFILDPGTLDGGDVLCLDREIFIGLSGRTNSDGAQQLSAIAGPLGCAVKTVPVRGFLHLKSAVTRVAPNALVINPGRIDAAVFGPREILRVSPDEPNGANSLLVGDRVIFPAACPKTARRLEQRGISLWRIDVSELAKAEGGVTCCSLIFEEKPQPQRRAG